MQKQQEKAGVKYHMSDVNVYQVDRGREGPDHKNVFIGRQTMSNTYTAL